MKASKLYHWIFPLLFVLTFIGCNDGGSGSSTKGNFDLSLTDATTDEYDGVYITIEEVQVHKSEGSDWKTVASLGKTYNLLELINGVREQLCIAELETGHYTQMRLIIGENPDNGLNILSERHEFGNYIIDKSGTCYELKVPSGYKTGVKIVHGFDINESQITELILDFDVSRSIVRAGNKGKCLLSPTIKVLNTKECSLISGIVTDFDSESAIEGVRVSAQIYDLEADDPKDSVVVQTSTITDEDGSYTIFLKPGEYNIVAFKDGYNLGCAKTVAISNSSYTQDFSLTPALTEVISGSVDIEEEDDDRYVTIAVRQAFLCTDSMSDEQIELISINIASGGNYYNISLPQGVAYTVVASTYGKETQEMIDVYPPEEVNILF